MRGLVLRDAHPGIDGDTAARQREHRVQVDFHELGHVFGQQREALEEVDGAPRTPCADGRRAARGRIRMNYGLEDRVCAYIPIAW
jgi:hypothetical protein